MKINHFLIPLLFWIFSFNHTLLAGDRVTLTGRALYSFSPDYFLLVTENVVYQISAPSLSERDLKVVNYSSIQNKLISINIPLSSIELSWPYEPQVSVEESRRIGLRVEGNIKEMEVKQGEMALLGDSIYSFSEPFFLIQSKDRVLRISKSKLSKEQNDLIYSVGPGGRLSLAIPQDSVQSAWNIEQPVEPHKPSRPLMEEYSVKNSVISVTGFVWLSFDESLLLIQSKDTIFQFEKKRVETETPHELNSPGSHVDIRAPLAALKLAWPSDTTKEGPYLPHANTMN